MNKRTKSKIEFTMFRLFYGLFNRIPYRMTERVLTSLFVFGGMVVGVRKKVALQNLQTIFPHLTEEKRKKILKKMYYYMGKTIAEIYFGNYSKMVEKTTVKGWENLEKAVSLNKGVILATCHSGNWEFAGKYIAANYPLAVIYKKLRNSFFDTFTNELRLKANIEVIHSKKSLKQIFSFLKKNYILTILIDQDAGKNGILTNFLGQPASTFPGTAKIAIKTGTPIVPAIALRDENDNNLFIFEEIILPSEVNDEDESVLFLTEKISLVLEKYILEQPEHWFWVHRRWKGAHKVLRKKEKLND